MSYVLPIASERPVRDAGLTKYLRWVGRRCDLIVVDGSPPDVFSEHERQWGRFGRHVPPDTNTVMGKVGNVMTGVRLAEHDRVVIADDDVRYGEELWELAGLLDDADVVRPQNFFSPLPWHAVWDSGRSLLNRVAGGDWPGTLAVRRHVLLGAGGYSGDVMFENYELCRTVEAAGGRHVVAYGLFVRRLPPTTRHFFAQRTRQAYDELARPARLAAFLAVAPSLLALAATRRWRVLAAVVGLGSGLAVGVAEAGRRRAGAVARFPARCSLAAPLWIAERAVCVWAAAWARVRGGVVYRDQRIRRAALRPADRRRAVAAAGATP